MMKRSKADTVYDYDPLSCNAACHTLTATTPCVNPRIQEISSLASLQFSQCNIVFVFQNSEIVPEVVCFVLVHCLLQ